MNFYTNVFSDFVANNGMPSRKRQIINLLTLFFRKSPHNIMPLFRLYNMYSTGSSINRLVARLVKRKYKKTCELFSAEIDLHTTISVGISFPHQFSVVINGSAVIGRFCTIHPCILIGCNRHKEGAPVIGDFVFIGHGAKIIGNPQIGNFSFIAPGAIITKDIPPKSVVGSGINNIISDNGTLYVHDYLSIGAKGYLTKLDEKDY